ncbi:1-acyl-sn-glycerol-3-phosphate acyltransferase [uncultured Bacteroides sp.]|uniref:1-acyl-sn-glycerol-3-phosphate acyltransferase n=1 Tax=uncultured Bacteroides sp. TaxID=162156 RepID=UPI002AAA746B|nr:1-acyl-sn-glycerol-3-phosphate acyltransferase [uncultured Bacteroides sp.]
MKKAIFSFIYHNLMGWKSVVIAKDYDKQIICCAPHTSNWDFIIGKIFYAAIGRETGFMMKKEWFFFPLGNLLRYMGGIPVNRGKKNSMVEQVAKVIEESKKFSLAITPEATRSRNPNWKKGFYYIATKANIPIVLVAIDYSTKTVIAEKVIIPSGNIEKDMHEIKLYFHQFKGKNPENFTTGL